MKRREFVRRSCFIAGGCFSPIIQSGCAVFSWKQKQQRRMFVGKSIGAVSAFCAECEKSSFQRYRAFDAAVGGILDHVVVFYDIGGRRKVRESYRIADILRYSNIGKGVVIALSLHAKNGVLGDLARGKYDADLRWLARRLARESGRFFIIRPWFECNGSWYAWQPLFKPREEGLRGNEMQDFAVAWNQTVRIFEETGAPVAFEFSLNRRGVNEPSTNFAPFFDGVERVDMVAISSYNRRPEKWRSFADEFGPAYEEVQRYVGLHVPINVGETSSVPSRDGTGDRKAAWIRDMFASCVYDFPRVKIISYFPQTVTQRDHVPMQWGLETPEQMSAFIEGSRYWKAGGKK